MNSDSSNLNHPDANPGSDARRPGGAGYPIRQKIPSPGSQPYPAQRRSASDPGAPYIPPVPPAGMTAPQGSSPQAPAPAQPLGDVVLWARGL